MNSVKDALPLTEGFYYILLTLYTEPRHGYAMMQEVEKMSRGRLVIGAGTLYTALNTLLKKGLIQQTETASDVDARRKMYAITEDGRRVLAAELNRLDELLENGRMITGFEGRMSDEQ